MLIPTVGTRHRLPFKPDTGYSWLCAASTPPSMSTRPAPIGSGSSVTSGRCWAIARGETESNPRTVNKAIAYRRWFIRTSLESLESFAAIQQQRDRAVVDERYLHHRLKLASLRRDAVAPQLANDVFVQRPGYVRRRGLVEGRAAALPAIARERELRDHEDCASHVLNRQVDMPGRVGRIFEDAQFANLAGDVVDIGRPIALFDADEDQQPSADLSGRTVSDGDGGAQHPLDDGLHKIDVPAACASPARARSSAGGFRRVSSKCLGATLLRALSID